MDLGLDIFETGIRGRPPERLVAEFVRALTPEDIAKLSGPRNTKKPFHLKRLSQRHHNLARSLAGGMKQQDAAFVNGYLVATVNLLLSDPTFQNLVEFYKEEKDREYRQAHAMMATLGVDVIDSLHDDLDNDQLTPGQKIEVMKATMDRTGNGPATTATHKHEHTINVAERLGAARKRLEQRTIIDITPEKKEDAA